MRLDQTWPGRDGRGNGANRSRGEAQGVAGRLVAGLSPDFGEELAAARRRVAILEEANRAVQEALDRMARISNFAEDLDRTAGTDEVTRVLFEQVRATLPATVLLLDFVDEAGLEFRPGYADPPSQAAEVRREVAGQMTAGVFRWTIGMRRPTSVPLNSGLGSLLLVPVSTSRRIVGMLVVVSCLQPSEIEHQHLSLLTLLARQAAEVIDNIWLREDVARQHEAMRSASEAALARRVADLGLLVETAARFSGTLDREAVLRYLIDAPQRHLAIEMVVILLLDPAGRLGVAAKTGALPHASMPDSFGREEAAFVWRILDCQQPLAWQPQSGTDPETPLPGLAADEVRAFLGVPLMVRDHPVGVLCVLSSSVRVFAPHEIALLSGLAAQGALALDNNRLFTEVERRMDKQHRALRRLAKSSRLTSVGMLAAGVAHDLNNPLCVISNHLQFLALRRTQLDPELQEALASIDTCVQRMAGTIQALLQYARSHGDRRIPVDLNEVTRRFLGFLPPPRACRPVRIELDLAADLPPVCLDVSAWQQVLFELVTNAHEAMPDGGIIRVRTQRLGPPAGGEIASGPTHGVEVRVEDEGIGILPTELNQLFDPFYTTKGFDRVMGMGLWICREVVEEHGGDIRAESDGHAGTRVVIRLPAADEIPSGPDGSEIDYLR